MTQYNVDFFDLSLTCIHHDITNSFSVDDDYLSPSTSSITIAKTNKLAKNNLIYIQGLYDFFGVITELEDDDYTTTVSFEPYINLFNQNVLIDTNNQSDGTTLENFIANTIKTYWINSSDSKQNISNLTISVKTSTTSWGFNLKSDTEDMHHAIVGFYDTIIAKAMSKYAVAITAKPNFNTKKIELTIGKPTSDLFYIDADKDNVIIQTFTLKSPSTETNKLEIWNTANYTEKIYYYLHTTGKYDTNDSDRITPVVLEVMATTNSDEDSTFAQAAAEQAASTFDGLEWTNLIELNVSPNDKLINPQSMAYGQEVYIIHNGSAYSSILTGKNLSETITLIFGTVRHDLTKILKMGG